MALKPTTGNWLALAEEYLDGAAEWLAEGRYLDGACETHQAAEMALKAVLAEAGRVLPAGHNLRQLARRAGMRADGPRISLDALHAFRTAQMAVRGPADWEELRQVIDALLAGTLLASAREVVAWASARLQSTDSSGTAPPPSGGE